MTRSYNRGGTLTPMLRKDPVSLKLIDETNRTVIVEGVRTSLGVRLGPAAVFGDYARPTRVIHRRDGEETRVRIVDLGVMLRAALAVGVLAAILIRRSSK